MIRGSWCALLVLWLLLAPTASANDFGLVNPAEKDFAEIRSEKGNTGNFSRRTPAFNDRALPAPSRTEPIQQVSTFDNDPFQMAAQSTPPQGSVFPFTWEPAPSIAQNDGTPHDPSAFGYVNPHFAMQEMQNMHLAQQFAQQQLAQQQFAQQQFAQQQFAQQQFAQQQFAEYPQQYQQGYMVPPANVFMNPYADMYTQYGYVDPYETWQYSAGQQAMVPQEVPNHAAMYHAFLLQEMARRQAESTQANDTKESGETKPQAESQWTLNNLVPVRVSSPLGETMLAGAKVMSPFSTPPGPHKGVGMPLVNRSWLDHPYYAGGFVGYISGSKELVSQMIEQKSGGTGGFTFGYNFNDYWGLESRLHFASIDIRDTDYARQLFESNYQSQFPGMGVPPLATRTNQLTILDAAVQYYPLGNAKWRPYFKYGLGIGQQKFVNTFGYDNKANIVTMPLGVGVRYWWNERIAIQADLLNNMVFASDIAKTQHNVSFTVGLTYAFGSSRTKHPVHYWPATPSMGTRW